MRYILLLFTALFCFQSQAKNDIDSLRNIIYDQKNADTTIGDACIKLSARFIRNNMDSSLKYLDIAVDISRENLNRNPSQREKDIFYKILGGVSTHRAYIYNVRGQLEKAVEAVKMSNEIAVQRDDKGGLAIGYNNIAMIYGNLGYRDSVESYLLRCLELQKEIGDFEHMADTYNNLGSYFHREGLIQKSIEYHQKSYETAKKHNKVKVMGYALSNLANIHIENGDTSKAIDYTLEAEKIFIAEDDINDLMPIYNNLGTYYKGNNYEMAEKYFKMSYDLAIKTKNKDQEATSYQRFAQLAIEKKDYDLALNYLFKSIRIADSISKVQQLADSYITTSNVYGTIGNIEEQYRYAKLALDISEKTKDLKAIRNASKQLHLSSAARKDWQDAYTYYGLYIKSRDSLDNIGNKKAALEQKYSLDYDRKLAEDSIREIERKKVADAQLKIKDAQIKQEKTQRYALYGGLGLTLVFGAFILYRLRLSRKQNKIIALQKTEVETQKHLVDEKNQEILDSINYAKRLQDAILPSISEVKSRFPESFIYYKPKDIVAGDFYWMEENDEFAYFAVADCTGHGVPGAMVSVVCSNALSKSVLELGIKTPGEILDSTRELVIKQFKNSDTEIKDGMDISLLAVLKKEKKIYWAGANNPLWIIDEAGNLNEIKADKQPIGKYDHESSFTTHEIAWERGQKFYMFSDGFPDQFGGEKGKKYKSARLKKFIAGMASHNMTKQKDLLDKEFSSWTEGYEQIDDVCFVGIEINQ